MADTFKVGDTVEVFDSWDKVWKRAQITFLDETTLKYHTEDGWDNEVTDPGGIGSDVLRATGSAPNGSAPPPAAPAATNGAGTYKPGDIVMVQRGNSVVRGRIYGFDYGKYGLFYGGSDQESGVDPGRIQGLAPAQAAYQREDIVKVRQDDGSFKLARINGISGTPGLAQTLRVANVDGYSAPYEVSDSRVSAASPEEIKQWTPSRERAEWLAAEIVKEVNAARQNPKEAARRLQGLELLDGASTVDPGKRQVAIDFLNQMSLRNPLSAAAGLAKAAMSFASDPGPIDGPAHRGSDGSTAHQRMARFGTGGMGECLNASHVTPFAFVASFLMSPGHRDILVDEQATHIGVGTFFHAPPSPDHEGFIRCVINTGATWRDS
jgi:hypothetical protein